MLADDLPPAGRCRHVVALRQTVVIGGAFPFAIRSSASQNRSDAALTR